VRWALDACIDALVPSYGLQRVTVRREELLPSRSPASAKPCSRRRSALIFPRRRTRSADQTQGDLRDHLQKLSTAAQKSLKASDEERASAARLDLAVQPITPVEPPAEEQTVTVGDIVALPKDDAALEGFAMSDEPFEPLVDVENVPEAIVGGHGLSTVPHSPSPPTSLPGYIAPTDNVSYESRIRILEAFRYPGSFRNAPDWIDRNWLGHGDWDPLRQIEPGPPCASLSTAASSWRGSATTSSSRLWRSPKAY
jgi:hypothetical protein